MNQLVLAGGLIVGSGALTVARIVASRLDWDRTWKFLLALGGLWGAVATILRLSSGWSNSHANNVLFGGFWIAAAISVALAIFIATAVSIISSGARHGWSPRTQKFLNVVDNIVRPIERRVSKY